MTYCLYLDDERDPKTNREWIVVRSYEEFVKHIETHGAPSYASLDHDLGTEMNGYDCVKWLVGFCMENKVDPNSIEIHAHTANPVGRDNILGYVKSWKGFYDNK